MISIFHSISIGALHESPTMRTYVWFSKVALFIPYVPIACNHPRASFVSNEYGSPLLYSPGKNKMSFESTVPEGLWSIHRFVNVVSGTWSKIGDKRVLILKCVALRISSSS